jgi:hypothetical protein
MPPELNQLFSIRSYIIITYIYIIICIRKFNYVKLRQFPLIKYETPSSPILLDSIDTFKSIPKYKIVKLCHLALLKY